MATLSGKGNSKANTTSESSTSNVTNVDNSIRTVDAGALATAQDISIAALDSAAESGRGARELISQVVSDAFDTVGGGLGDTLNFADRQNARVTDAALATGETLLSGLSDTLNFADRQNTRSSDAALETNKSLLSGLFDILNFGDRQNARLADAADANSARIADIADTSAQRALQFGGSVLADAGGLVRSAFEDAFSTASDVLKEGQAQVATTVSNLNNIARQQSTTDSERFQNIVKWALGAAAAMVAVFALSRAR